MCVGVPWCGVSVKYKGCRSASALKRFDRPVLVDGDGEGLTFFVIHAFLHDGTQRRRWNITCVT